MSENEFNYPFTQCPGYCPKCMSSNLSGGDQNYDLDCEVKEYSCIDCDFEWSETWKFQTWKPS